jgi:hypothetical protein
LALPEDERVGAHPHEHRTDERERPWSEGHDRHDRRPGAEASNPPSDAEERRADEEATIDRAGDRKYVAIREARCPARPRAPGEEKVHTGRADQALRRRGRTTGWFVIGIG